MSVDSKVLLALGSVLTVASPSALAIEVSVATDKPSYHPGEAIYISVTAYNPGPEDVMLYFGSTLQAQYTLDGVFTNPVWGFDILTNALVPAHGSKVWTYRHYWDYYNLALGSHNVQGNVVGYGTSALVSFSVTAPTLPTDSFLVDFDTLPSEKQQVTALEEYWPWGVHIETLGGGTVGIYQSGDNGFAATYSTTYPPGFNIVVRFDIPVYGATAHVSTAAGYRVTMIGRDVAGVILDSVTSPVVPAYEEFVGPLRIRSDYPIGSLEYWPSITNAAVLIDNVYLSLVYCVPADFELDDDVDLRDFGTFQTSFNGSNQPPPTDWDTAADLDGDADVDLMDFILFQACFNGPNQPPACE